MSSDTKITYTSELNEPIKPADRDLAALVDNNSDARENYLAQHKKAYSKANFRSGLMAATLGVVLLTSMATSAIFAASVLSAVLLPVAGPLLTALLMTTTVLGIGIGAPLGFIKIIKKYQNALDKMLGLTALKQLNDAEAKRLNAALAPFMEAYQYKQKAIKAALNIKIAEETARGEMVPTALPLAEAAPLVAEQAQPVRPVLAPARSVVQPRVKITDGPIRA